MVGDFFFALPCFFPGSFYRFFFPYQIRRNIGVIVSQEFCFCCCGLCLPLLLHQKNGRAEVIKIWFVSRELVVLFVCCCGRHLSPLPTFVSPQTHETEVNEVNEVMKWWLKLKTNCLYRELVLCFCLWKTPFVPHSPCLRHMKRRADEWCAEAAKKLKVPWEIRFCALCVWKIFSCSSHSRKKEKTVFWWMDRIVLERYDLCLVS